MFKKLFIAVALLLCALGVLGSIDQSKIDSEIKKSIAQNDPEVFFHQSSGISDAKLSRSGGGIVVEWTRSDQSTEKMVSNFERVAKLYSVRLIRAFPENEFVIFKMSTKFVDKKTGKETIENAVEARIFRSDTNLVEEKNIEVIELNRLATHYWIHPSIKSKK